jgi:hypothetical protein
MYQKMYEAAQAELHSTQERINALDVTAETAADAARLRALREDRRRLQSQRNQYLAAVIARRAGR